MDHPVVGELSDKGVLFTSFDKVYEQGKSFEEIYDHIVESLLAQSHKQSIIYAVPGHPMLAERTVQLLLEQKSVPVEIVGGSSYLDDLFSALKIDPIEGFQLIDATAFDRSELNYQQHLVFCQVYDQFIASNVKLKLLEDLPIDYPIIVIDAVGSRKELIKKISLQDLDRFEQVSNLTSVYVPPVPDEKLNHTFHRIREIIATLRGPNGCEWDKTQTHETLREYAIEEVYELIDAIDLQDDEGIIEELGDVLLQVLLHSQIGEDHGYFTIDDVIRRLSEKMIYRHPHVFGEETVDSVDDIHENWEALKLGENNRTRKSILDDIPKSLPSLTRALKLQKRAAKVGFDWDQVDDIWSKLDEELQEFKDAIKTNDHTEIESEIGDILFSIVNLARHYKVNAEIALNRTNRKFLMRFHYIENKLKEEAKNIQETSLVEMDKYWNEAKKRGRKR